jgi:hypothetical protein
MDVGADDRKQGERGSASEREDARVSSSIPVV